MNDFHPPSRSPTDAHNSRLTALVKDVLPADNAQNGTGDPPPQSGGQGRSGLSLKKRKQRFVLVSITSLVLVVLLVSILFAKLASNFGRNTAAESANLVLIAEDYGVNVAAGYLLYYGEEEIAENAPSYAELAARRGAKIVLAKCVADGVLNADGTLNASEIGYTQLPQPDGTIRFTFEFEGRGGTAEGEWVVVDAIERAARYDVQLHLSNWEVTPEGDWLREDPENTYLSHEWTVAVTPAMKGE